LSEPRLGFERFRHSAVAKFAAVAKLVKSEQFGRQCGTPCMTLATLPINPYSHDLLCSHSD